MIRVTWHPHGAQSLPGAVRRRQHVACGYLSCSHPSAGYAEYESTAPACQDVPHIFAPMCQAHADLWLGKLAELSNYEVHR